MAQCTGGTIRPQRGRRGRQPPRACEFGQEASGNSRLQIVVDLPDLLPVTEGELELLESELADFIAELLKT